MALTPSIILLFISLFLSLSLVSGNNLAACVGTAVGARIIRLRSAALLGAAGFILGLLTLGHGMIEPAKVMLPSDPDVLLVSAILLGTVAVFLLGNVMRVPLSSTTALIGMVVGTSIASGHVIDRSYLIYVLGVWILAPGVSIAIAFFSTRAVVKSAAPRDPFARAKLYKLLILAASFLTAFASGSNTLALIVAISGFGNVQVLISIAAILFGSLYLSSRQIRRIGVEFLMLRYSNALITLLTSAFLMGFASMFGIPLSSTQTLSASVFGSGISYKHKLISTKPFLIIVAGWVIAPLLSLAIGLLLYGELFG